MKEKGLVIINGYVQEEKFFRQGRRIVDALERRGAEVTLVKNGDISVCINERGAPTCARAEGCSFAVYLDKDKYLGKALENCGLRLFNSARSVELCDDKLTTYTALQNRGLRLVQSIPAPLCYTVGAKINENFLEAVAEKFGFPLVAKKSYGSFGSGVRLISDYAELCQVEGEWLNIPHFYQKFVRVAAGRDVRVIVVGGRAIGGMERVAKKGEFRSNIELGGVGRAISLTATLRENAERAAQALGLEYCGVDLLEDEQGVLLCEVNSNAFFEGFERATGIDVADEYARNILEKIK